MSIVFRAAATQELLDLVNGIRAVDPAAAIRFEDSVRRTLAGLEQFPLTGERRRVRNPNVRGLRVAGVRRYRRFVVVYLPLPNGIEVLHIVRGSRRIGPLVAND